MRNSTIILISILYACLFVPEVHAKTDLERMQDVVEIAGQIERYKKETGDHPYQHWFRDVPPDEVAAPVSVHLTDQPLPERYQLPPPGTSGFVDTTEEFLTDMRYVLGRDLTLPFDDRKVVFEPPYIPTFYICWFGAEHYFVSANLTEPNEFTHTVRPGFYIFRVGSTDEGEVRAWKYKDIKEKIQGPASRTP